MEKFSSYSGADIWHCTIIDDRRMQFNRRVNWNGNNRITEICNVIVTNSKGIDQSLYVFRKGDDYEEDTIRIFNYCRYDTNN